ncbi:hypothetical protein GQ600_1534 [Phytophthora cactorum]|nr:hypothetical protein GQ600_1534 [Phytophthora cactorum]
MVAVAVREAGSAATINVTCSTQEATLGCPDGRSLPFGQRGCGQVDLDLQGSSELLCLERDPYTGLYETAELRELFPAKQSVSTKKMLAVVR